MADSLAPSIRKNQPQTSIAKLTENHQNKSETLAHGEEDVAACKADITDIHINSSHYHSRGILHLKKRFNSRSFAGIERSRYRSGNS